MSSFKSRSSSIDIFAGQGGSSDFPSSSSFEKLSRRSKSLSSESANKQGLVNTSPLAEQLGKFTSQEADYNARRQSLVWRDRPVLKPNRRWRTKKTLSMGLVVFTCLCLGYSKGFFSSGPMNAFSKRKTSTCNPFASAGQMHVDYLEPSNNYWQPSDASCSSAPRYMAALRQGDYSAPELRFMQNRTVLLIGDNIEREHVSQFCSLLGADSEVVKGRHRLSVSGDSAAEESAAIQGSRKKDRYSRIAFKGMQESTLPRVCHIPELNFLVANVYHFGLDEQDFWKTLDQFHAPGSIEERFSATIMPFVNKIRQEEDRLSAPDLVEISSGMYDLARWARMDIDASKNTEESLDKERLKWYESRMGKFMELVKQSFPDSIKMWRAVTLPEDQAAELDYFHDDFGHSPATVTPHFSVNRVHQIDEVARKLAFPLNPSSKAAVAKNPAARELLKSKRDGGVNPAVANEFIYNSWSSLLRGVPAHQLDRLHGGDVATPAAVLWADIMLWHLKQGVSA